MSDENEQSLPTHLGLKVRARDVYVRQVGRETRTASGLYMPDADHYARDSDGVATRAQRDEFPPRGRVEAVGSDVVDVKAGDEVYFARETDAKKGTRCRAIVPDPRVATPDERVQWENLIVMNEANIQLVFEIDAPEVRPCCREPNHDACPHSRGRYKCWEKCGCKSKVDAP